MNDVEKVKEILDSYPVKLFPSLEDAKRVIKERNEKLAHQIVEALRDEPQVENPYVGQTSLEGVNLAKVWQEGYDAGSHKLPAPDSKEYQKLLLTEEEILTLPTEMEPKGRFEVMTAKDILSEMMEVSKAQVDKVLALLKNR